MSFSHILRVLFAAFVSGAVGWVVLAGFYAVKIMRGFESFEASGPNAVPNDLFDAMEQAIINMQGGSALFLAAGIAGVLLSEIFKTRSLVFYAGATGGLAALLAAAFWQQAGAPGAAQAAGALASAGFVAGGIYWMIAGNSASRG
jgi:hypothetical protein